MFSWFVVVFLKFFKGSEYLNPRFLMVSKMVFNGLFI